MKKNLILLLLAVLGLAQQLSAQVHEYIPFVREGVKWVCYFNSYYCNAYNEMEWARYYPQGKTYFTLELKGDTVINGNTYKKMHKYSGASINESNDTVLVYLREEDKIVYGIIPNYYPDFFVGYGMWWDNPAVNIFQAALNGEEFILYDFNDTENYYSTIYSGASSYWAPYHDNYFSYDGFDKIPVGDKMAKRYRFNYKFSYNSDLYFIEGVGFDGHRYGYTLGYLYLNRDQSMHTHYDGFYLSHVEEDGRIIYKGVNYEQVMPNDGRMPIVQDGKIWVNERVVINKGDTTRSYYSYVISGNDPCHSNADHRLCHYYTGMKFDLDNDSIISILYEPIDRLGTLSIYTYFNWPLEEIIKNNKNILRTYYEVGSNQPGQLYWMRHGDSEFTITSYLARQNNPKVLSKDNFFAVEPLEINGFECDRYAYVDEDGEVLAYLVEGIGFDSRDMGDLLTPFTRRPDPDAEYQEWCGLSHVIKDGEIIYKGLCYDEKRVQEAMALGEPGDLNGDGVVSITDVTMLIEQVLNGPATGGPHRADGDMNGNGDINITDVVMLIEQVLQQ